MRLAASRVVGLGVVERAIGILELVFGPGRPSVAY